MKNKKLSWKIDEQTLRPVILDADLFRQEFSSDPYCEVIEKLWESKPHEALTLLDTQDKSFRAEVLRAECLGILGSLEEAENIFVGLLQENEGSLREATLRQHWGKILFTVGRYEDSLREFEVALKLRKELDALPDQVKSSELAVSRTNEVLQGR